MTSKHRWFMLPGSLLIAALISWASLGPGSTPAGAESSSRETPPPAGRNAAPPVPDVSTLYEEGTSAYHARLFADDDAVVLATEAGFASLVVGAPPTHHAISLGPVVARQGGTLVFWRSGSLRAVAISGGEERELVAVPSAPRYLLASEGQIAWIQATDEGTSLRTPSGGDVRVVYESEETISAAVLRSSVVYWVSVRRDGSWSIGRVSLDGQYTSSGAHQGRPPAMLALGQDGLYFYAGRERGVRRLTFDLKSETSVLSEVICSPLVVSSRVVCAYVGGLFDIPPASPAPHLLAAERAGPITMMAATSERAFWVAEAGNERLVVRSIALPVP